MALKLRRRDSTEHLKGNPSFATMLKVTRALGLKRTVEQRMLGLLLPDFEARSCL